MMVLQGKPVTEITEADIQGLITNKVRESQTLEFKREAHGRADEATREMLRDISAMANAFGGDLLIGVDEDNEGIAENLLGVDDAEEEAQRIVSSCLSNIQERIPRLLAWPVPLRNGRSIIVVHIPRSLRAPHMVTFKGLNQFWMRHDRQKSSMSAYEVRDTCLKIEGLMEKLEGFLQRRRQAILDDIGSLPYYAISITPLFIGSDIVDIRDPELRNILKTPLYSRVVKWTVPDETPFPTLYGLKTEIPDWKSVELFRNGHLEFLVKIDESFLGPSVSTGNQNLLAYPLIDYPLSFFHLGKAIYTYLSVTDPVLISLSLYNIRDFALYSSPLRPGAVPSTRVSRSAKVWKNNSLEIPAREFPTLEQPEKVMREVVDRLWQAFGHEEAPLFDANGKYVR